MNFNPIYGPYIFVPFEEENKEQKKNEFERNLDEYFYSPLKVKLVSPEEGFIRGNLFDKEYEGYQNYQIYLDKPKDEKNDLMRRIQIYAAAAHDLNLYLDIFPQERELFEKFKEYIREAEKAKAEYQSKYSPIYPGASTFVKGNFSWDLAPSTWII